MAAVTLVVWAFNWSRFICVISFPVCLTKQELWMCAHMLANVLKCAYALYVVLVSDNITVASCPTNKSRKEEEGGRPVVVTRTQFD